MSKAQKLKPANRWRFYVSSAGRTVTVSAPNYCEAELRARDLLDRRAEAQDVEAPVAWDLCLACAWHVEKKKAQRICI